MCAACFALIEALASYEVVLFRLFLAPLSSEREGAPHVKRPCKMLVLERLTRCLGRIQAIRRPISLLTCFCVPAIMTTRDETLAPYRRQWKQDVSTRTPEVSARDGPRIVHANCVG